MKLVLQVIFGDLQDPDFIFSLIVLNIIANLNLALFAFFLET